MSQLDMTHSSNRGKELVDEIVKVVGDSQAFILTPLPDELVLSPEQYTSVLPYEDYVQPMADYSMFLEQITEQSKEKLFYTPHNVMEVRVKEKGNAA